LKTKFREVQKSRLGIRVPVKIAEKVRMRAAKENRSESEVSSEILAREFGLDPASFGIGETFTKGD
jgi:hypothetical protein